MPPLELQHKETKAKMTCIVDLDANDDDDDTIRHNGMKLIHGYKNMFQCSFS